MGSRGSQGDLAALSATITDEMLTEFALVARWDDMADALINRYRGTADRGVHLAADSIIEDLANLTKWGAIARAVHRAG